MKVLAQKYPLEFLRCFCFSPTWLHAVNSMAWKDDFAHVIGTAVITYFFISASKAVVRIKSIIRKKGKNNQPQIKCLGNEISVKLCKYKSWNEFQNHSKETFHVSRKSALIEFFILILKEKKRRKNLYHIQTHHDYFAKTRANLLPAITRFAEQKILSNRNCRERLDKA